MMAEGNNMFCHKFLLDVKYQVISKPKYFSHLWWVLKKFYIEDAKA